MQFKIGNYIRVSTEEQAMRTEGSLDSQKHRLTSFVDIKNMQMPGWGTVVESYIDDGYSAKDTNRPQLQRLLRDLKVGRINMVLVADYSRLSRSIRDFCELLDYFKEAGAKILSLKEQFDTTTAAGELMLFSMIGLAQFERRQISERVILNFHSRALRGLRNGGQPALGFEVDSQNKSIWKINAEEAKHVRAIFDWYLEENSLYRVARRLRDQKIPFRSYSKRQGTGSSESWSSQTLSNMLRNYGYAGLREVNKQNKEKDKKSLLPHQEYQIVKAAWPAIVEEEVFWSVQKRLEENVSLERARVRNSEKRIFLLSHVAKCSECGRALVGVTAHGRNNIFRYYAHRGNEGKKITCAIRSYPADKMEHAVTNHLFQVLNREGYLDGIEKQFGTNQMAIHQADEILRRRLRTEIKQTEIELKRLVKLQLQTDDEDLQSLYVDQLKELKAQHQVNQKQLKDLEQMLESVGSAAAFRKNLETNLRRLQESWVTKAFILRKKLVQSVIARLVFGDGKIDILYHSEVKGAIGAGSQNTHALEKESSAGMNLPRISRLRSDVSPHNQRILGSFVVKDGRG